MISLHKFQFHKGTIRTDNPREICVKLDNFNSIKVQLELEQAGLNPNLMMKFQFHKGTIRTVCSRVLAPAELYFNSIKVQLERQVLPLLLQVVLYFNSIKVQLERTAETAPTADTSFQFHKGTIRTR